LLFDFFAFGSIQGTAEAKKINYETVIEFQRFIITKSKHNIFRTSVHISLTHKTKISSNVGTPKIR